MDRNEREGVKTSFHFGPAQERMCPIISVGICVALFEGLPPYSKLRSTYTQVPQPSKCSIEGKMFCKGKMFREGEGMQRTSFDFFSLWRSICCMLLVGVCWDYRSVYQSQSKLTGTCISLSESRYKTPYPASQHIPCSAAGAVYFDQLTYSLSIQCCS